MLDAVNTRLSAHAVAGGLLIRAVEPHEPAECPEPLAPTPQAAAMEGVSLRFMGVLSVRPGGCRGLSPTERDPALFPAEIP